MKTKILLTILMIAGLAACNKDKYNTKPTLTLRSINTKDVAANSNLVFEFVVTDKEGDISDSIYVKKVRLNRVVVPTIRDSFSFRLPDVPNTTKSFVTVDLGYQNYLISAINPRPTVGPPAGRESDTLLFKFVLKDKAKNISDTFTSEQIVIRRQ